MCMAIGMLVLISIYSACALATMNKNVIVVESACIFCVDVLLTLDLS